VGLGILIYSRVTTPVCLAVPDDLEYAE
jgi:hypothetical protein